MDGISRSDLAWVSKYHLFRGARSSKLGFENIKKKPGSLAMPHYNSEVLQHPHPIRLLGERRACVDRLGCTQVLGIPRGDVRQSHRLVTPAAGIYAVHKAHGFVHKALLKIPGATIHQSKVLMADGTRTLSPVQSVVPRWLLLAVPRDGHGSVVVEDESRSTWKQLEMA